MSMLMRSCDPEPEVYCILFALFVCLKHLCAVTFMVLWNRQIFAQFLTWPKSFKYFFLAACCLRQQHSTTLVFQCVYPQIRSLLIFIWIITLKVAFTLCGLWKKIWKYTMAIIWFVQKAREHPLLSRPFSFAKGKDRCCNMSLTRLSSEVWSRVCKGESGLLVHFVCIIMQDGNIACAWDIWHICPQCREMNLVSFNPPKTGLDIYAFFCFHQQQKLLLNSKKQVAQLTPFLQPINELFFDSNNIPMSSTQRSLHFVPSSKWYMYDGQKRWMW